MRIAVCLKHVPDTATVEIDPFSGAIDEGRLLYTTSPADTVALELALRLAGAGGTLLALSAGPAAADETLRAALAVGAARALRLWDAGLADLIPPRTALLLATALRAEGLPDLVLCGSRSSDSGSGQVPALLAEFLGWPVLTDVTQIELLPGAARVQRRLDRGARAECEVALPAVLAVEPGLLRLRHASLPGLLHARRATIPVHGLGDLGLQAGDLAFPAPALLAAMPPRPRPRPIFTPDSARAPHERITQIITAGVTRKSGKVIEGPPAQMADTIVEFLRERGFVGKG